MTGIPDGVRDVEYARTVWRLDEAWIDGVSRKYLTAKPDLFRNFLSRGQEVGNKLTVVSRELYETVDAGRSALSDNNLRDFMTWAKHFHENATFILVTHPLAKSVEIRLLEILKKYGMPPAALEQALLDLSISRKSNAAEEENFDLFFIQNRMGSPDFDLEAALQEHTRKHAYLKYRDPFSGGYTIDDFRERLKGKLELPNYFQPYADIIGQFGTDETELVELQEEFVFYRTFRTERSYEALYYLERYLAALEEANGLGPHELSYCSKEELIRFLQSGRRVDLSLLDERRLDFAMLLHEGSVSVLTAQAAQQWISGKLVESSLPVSEVRGLTAYRGSAIGRARIVMNTADQDAVSSGDILIVPMTTPDYLPSMQKAAAFVTDEGGVICHAAIIARELKKPCVIGTKKATSVFRDGDWVEVDGFTGVVRLVPRSAQTRKMGK
ncbi:MAG: PEP-utilizing enzyme [Nitrospirae bacterium]|nr:PEP-utilizing enzyme [Nitrospirota bacterium]